MNSRINGNARLDTPADVGTLWTLECQGRRARCALLAGSSGWEIRVIVETKTLLAERCATAADAFALGEEWKSRLLEKRWRQVVPNASRPVQDVEHPPL